MHQPSPSGGKPAKAMRALRGRVLVTCLQVNLVSHVGENVQWMSLPW
jgi:hypothetical protein